jgi:hypothetical protein
MSQKTRSAALLEELQKEIAARRAHIDASPDIAEITISIKWWAGTATVKGTQYSEERVLRVRER